MTRVPQTRTVIAAIVASSLMLGIGTSRPLDGAETGSAAVRGVIYLADAHTHAVGAVAIAIDARSGDVHRSQPTGSKGAYEITGLPAGTYDIAIEVAGKIYVGEMLVDLEEGASRSISFATLPGRAPFREIQAVGTAEGVALAVEPEKGGVPRRSGARKFWSTAGWTALAAALTAALVGGGNGGEPVVSPSQP